MAYSFQSDSNAPMLEQYAEAVALANAKDSPFAFNLRSVAYHRDRSGRLYVLIELPPEHRAVFYYNRGSSATMKASQADLPFPWTYIGLNVEPYLGGLVAHGVACGYSAEQIQHQLSFDGVGAFLGNHSPGTLCMGYGYSTVYPSLTQLFIGIASHYLTSTFNNNITDYIGNGSYHYLGLKSRAADDKTLYTQFPSAFGSYGDGAVPVTSVYPAVQEALRDWDWSQYPRGFRLPFVINPGKVQPYSNSRYPMFGIPYDNYFSKAFYKYKPTSFEDFEVMEKEMSAAYSWESNPSLAPKDAIDISAQPGVTAIITPEQEYRRYVEQKWRPDVSYGYTPTTKRKTGLSLKFSKALKAS